MRKHSKFGPGDIVVVRSTGHRGETTSWDGEHYSLDPCELSHPNRYKEEELQLFDEADPERPCFGRKPDEIHASWRSRNVVEVHYPDSMLAELGPSAQAQITALILDSSPADPALQAAVERGQVTCADEAKAVVCGERRDSYGPVDKSLSRTAKIWSGILDFDVKPEQVALCLGGLKLAREAHTHKHDNLVDMCGYALVLERFYKGE